MSFESKMEVRDELFSDLNLIDLYIRKNPDGMGAEDLSIIKGWKKAVIGSFYIERYLKNHAIFVGSEGGGDENVYAVKGLVQGFDAFFHKADLPMYINTVLLPFKGIIVIDGFMTHRNIYFGGGIKRSLKEDYMRAKQNGRIIDSLGDAQSIKSRIIAKNWKPELKKLTTIAKKLKGGVNQPVLYGPMFAHLKASIEMANQIVENPESLPQDELYDALNKIGRAHRKLAKIIDRMD